MERAVRIAIVEDSASDRALLVENLRRYERERGLRFELVEFADGEDLVTGYAADYDMILMDIEMAFMDGMRAAAEVRALDENVTIIFITNMPQYAIEGYRVRAEDYILKPISWFSFSESLTRALRMMKTGTEADYVAIAMKGGRMKLELDKLCYLEVQDHQLIYNTRDGRFVAKGAMRDVETLLTAPRFFRCNRCYIVNLQYVESTRGADITVHGDTIQVSRSRRKAFMDALNAYLNGADTCS